MSGAVTAIVLPIEEEEGTNQQTKVSMRCPDPQIDGLRTFAPFGTTSGKEREDLMRLSKRNRTTLLPIPHLRTKEDKVCQVVKALLTLTRGVQQIIKATRRFPCQETVDHTH